MIITLYLTLLALLCFATGLGAQQVRISAEAAWTDLKVLEVNFLEGD